MCAMSMQSCWSKVRTGQSAFCAGAFHGVGGFTTLLPLNLVITVAHAGLSSVVGHVHEDGTGLFNEVVRDVPDGVREGPARRYVLHPSHPFTGWFPQLSI